MNREELESRYAARGREIVDLRRRLGRQAATIRAQDELIAELRAEIVAPRAEVEELRRSAHRQANRFGRVKDKLSKDPKRPGGKAGQGKWSRGAGPSEEHKAKAQTKTSCLAHLHDGGRTLGRIHRPWPGRRQGCESPGSTLGMSLRDIGTQLPIGF